LLLKQKHEKQEKQDLTSSPVFKKMNIFTVNKKNTQLNLFTKNVPNMKFSPNSNNITNKNITTNINKTATITSYLTQIANYSVEKKYHAITEKSTEIKKPIVSRIHNIDNKTRNKVTVTANTKSVNKSKHLNFSLNPNNTSHASNYHSLYKTLTSNKIKLTFTKETNPESMSKSPAHTKVLQSPDSSYSTNLSKIECLLKNTMNRTLNMKIRDKQSPEKAAAEPYNFKNVLSRNIKKNINYQIYKANALKKKHINLSGLSKSRTETSAIKNKV
jgi:hypothetical protein